MQRQDQNHWFELAIEDVERRLRSHRRGKKQGTVERVAGTASSWSDVVSVYQDIAGRNLWSTERDPVLQSLLNQLVSYAVGCLPQEQGSTLSGCSTGRSLMHAMEILLPFIEHGHVQTVAVHVEAIIAGCLDVIKRGGEDSNRGEDGAGDGVTEEDGRAIVDSAYELLSAIITRGAALERVRVKKSVLTGLVSKVGSLLAGGKAGKMASKAKEKKGLIRWTPTQVMCLEVCLMRYPQALKHAVDGLGEVAAQGNLEVYVMLARVGGTAEGWSGRGNVVMGSIDAVLDVLLDGLESGRTDGGYPSCGILAVSTGDERRDGMEGKKGQAADKKHGIQCLQTASFPQAIKHLEKLFGALIRLITTAFPVAVPMPITRIIGLVRRLLAVDITRIHLIQRVGRTTGQVTSLGAALPRLQMAALDVLKSMMAVCHGHVVPHMSQVNDMLRGGLETILAHRTHGRDEMQVGVVCGLYSAVEESLRVDGVAGGIAFEDALVELVEAHMYVMSNHEHHSTGTGDALGGTAGMDYQGALTTIQTDNNNKDALTISLLGVLEALFYRAASAIKHASRMYLEDVVLHIGKSAHQLVQHAQITTTRDCLREQMILEAALGTLEASVIAPSVHRPTHAAEALRLFRTVGSRSKTAMRAMQSLEIVMHPRSLDMRVKMDNSEVTARHELGIPYFWLATTSDIVQVVMASHQADPECPTPGDKQQTAQPNREDPIAHADHTRGDAHFPTQQAINKGNNNLSTGAATNSNTRTTKPSTAMTAAKRTAVASSTGTDDSTKRFKVAKAPARERDEVDPDDHRHVEQTRAETKKLDAQNIQSDSDEDDFLGMIDSGDDSQ